MDLNPDIVTSLVDKAQIFHGKEGVIMPDDTTAASGNLAADMLTDHHDDNTRREFKSAIEELEPDQRLAVVALMWIGRGDFEPSEWDAAIEQARDEASIATADYLLGTPLLSDYLREGLAALGYPTGH